MKPSPEQKTQIKPTQIAQVDPQSGLDIGGEFVELIEVHSWGVVAHLLNVGLPGKHRLTWQHIEMTGGAVVWKDGKRLAPPAEAVKHHE